MLKLILMGLTFHASIVTNHSGLETVLESTVLNVKSNHFSFSGQEIVSDVT